jgi:hypothetical protein
MRIKFIFVFVLLLTNQILQSIIIAQTSAIPWSSFNNGFAVQSSANISITSGVGQSLVGSMQQGNTRIESGFLVPVSLITAVDENGVKQIPLTYKLYQNYPNPFNPSTTIQFDIPKLSKVTLKIIDMLGREVATLVDEQLQPGEHKVIFDTGKLPSGVYFFRMDAEEFSATKKLMLLK